MEEKNIPLLADGDQTEYLSRIRNHYSLLSDAEKRIANYILQNKTSIVDIPVKELAKKTDSSPATIIRFCQALGFKGYAELKFYIERELLSPFGEKEEINPNDSIKVLKQKIFQFQKQVIDDTQMVLNDEELEKAINAISKAQKIELYGEGGSGAIALTAFNILMQIGLPCQVHNDAFLQVMSASQLKKGDVAIGIAHSGRVINTLDALKVAREQGATTICITGYANSPITEYSDIVLYTSSKSSSMLSDMPAARISELCVISILQLGVVTRNYEKVMGNVKKVKQTFRLKRIY
ncbi:MurR/RpiR family transcriptional regulator [Petroclostridium sp. X23]|uniref:MurR/RpiR family transcriptional regulator n=1 Tax=Petroclostridium sp. X23 TaxID=3045146 RepID=UPI0024ADEF52|nr:MurR/RpiR family transcriptional regulator [Petroclostridium sp. X23]WHH57326.1 MurR/RpiR family transcriptional regulator [Petroclostridium sp. X23]